MILRAMTAKEFSVYRTLFVHEYAADLAATRRCGMAEATHRAKESFDLALDKGIATPLQRLWCLVSAEQHILGYLWITMSDRSAWISDFYIYSTWRGNGFGAEALQHLTQTLIAEGIPEIGLRVAPQNGAAKHLYEKCGFAVTGFNMSKRLI